MTSPETCPHLDDIVVPFRLEQTEASGRVVRLGPLVDDILTRHAYPDKVSEILGQALLLVAMFGSMIKDRQSTTQVKQPNRKERFILQTQTDGPVSLIVADYVHPGHLRGYARFDESRFADLDINRLLGKGHLAMTIDRGDDTDRYQGIVALEGEGENAGLAGAANQYFAQSEQLPTYIHLAMARHFDATAKKEEGDLDGWHWRGGALMVQKLTSVGGHKTDGQQSSGIRDEDSWNRTRILAHSLKDHELLDPLLSSQELLYRLYHEDGVRVFECMKLQAACSCSSKGAERMLKGITKNERKDIIKDDGKVHITCEFCNRHYEVTPEI